MVVGFTTTCAISVSSNPAHAEVYSMQHYVIKFVRDFWQVDGFRHDIAEKNVENGVENHEP
jgi:hypothetical protein